MENSKTALRQDEEFISGLQGLMDWLGISKTTAYRMKKKIPHLQIGKTIRFRKADVLKALEKNYETIES